MVLKLVLKSVLFCLVKAIVFIYVGLFLWNNVFFPIASNLLYLEFPQLDIVTWIVYSALIYFPYFVLKPKENENKGEESDKKHLIGGLVGMLLSIYPSFLIWNKILIPVALVNFNVIFPELTIMKFILFKLIVLTLHIICVLLLSIIGVLVYKKFKERKK